MFEDDEKIELTVEMLVVTILGIVTPLGLDCSKLPEEHYGNEGNGSLLYEVCH